MIDEENPAMSDEENPVTPTCSLPHCDERAQSDACCTGANPHYLCDSCFCGYASSHFTATGAFTTERTSDDNIVSAPGELPCYRFLMNECECACISATTLARVLSTDSIALEAYESAKRRLIQARYDEEQANTGAAQVQRDQNATPVERLYRIVVDALSRGRYVQCPKCGFHGEKDNACMHMKCPCGIRYCYCCGRERGDGAAQCKSDGSGCDSPSPFLENHPGWESLALNGESAGAGALHEFHKRRMVYFLRQIKVNYPVDLWQQLREDNPNLLDGDPAEGVRSIEWHEIDTAEPPLFGNTTVEELAWKDDGLLTCVDHVVDEPAQSQQEDEPGEDVQEQAPRANRDQQDNGVRERMGPQAFVKAHPRFTAYWVIGIFLSIVMLSLGAVNDNQALRTVGKVLTAGLVGTALPLLAMWLVEYFAANPQEGFIREVQCIRGRNGELPYLATEGRWSQRRVLYWYSFFCGIALASLCLASKNRPVLYGFGAFLLSEILLLYGGITTLVNAQPPPREAEPLYIPFKHFVNRVCIFSTILSIGVGILAVPSEPNNNGNVAGKVFFALGFAGALAEVLPRIQQVYRGDRLFVHTPDTHRLVLSYIVCMGVAVGSLMVGLSYTGPVNVAGIVVIVVSLLLFFPAFSAR